LSVPLEGHRGGIQKHTHKDTQTNRWKTSFIHVYTHYTYTHTHAHTHTHTQTHTQTNTQDCSSAGGGGFCVEPCLTLLPLALPIEGVAVCGTSTRVTHICTLVYTHTHTYKHIFIEIRAHTCFLCGAALDSTAPSPTDRGGSGVRYVCVCFCVCLCLSVFIHV
jgi:hypothetical protein